ncbi:MFS transporter [Oceanobacillus indicireducens]|uniref:Major facilitator superfamily (MFS) profile domain-containing protein n=1 Tax=Oceanobacillus indicireducens TaxID=1004261 RepID=A0A918D5T2_9BACI|nr:MFS transporter [Oceanobacillus indicireducens]GGN67691.1 hypothetical protein GCM10007971_38750 [Oceanobacillus indicireducens]
MKKFLLKIKIAVSQLPKTILFLLVSRFLISFTRFMVFPFLAIYLNTHTDLSITQIGFLIGLSPLASTIFGLIGGKIVDRFESRYVYMLSLFVNAIVLPGYILFSDFYTLSSVAVISGISWNLYNTCSQTVISLNTPKKQLVEVFSYSYWMFNLGGTIGPLTGALLASMHIEVLAFFIFSMVLTILAFLTPLLISKYNSKLNKKMAKSNTSIRSKVTNGML